MGDLNPQSIDYGFIALPIELVQPIFGILLRAYMNVASIIVMLLCNYDQDSLIGYPEVILRLGVFSRLTINFWNAYIYPSAIFY